MAPHNAQANLLRRILPDGAQVGTVDKFQGQEAQLVLVSMTTSSGHDLPRNIEFLYSKNRLNVAIGLSAMCRNDPSSPARVPGSKPLMRRAWLGNCLRWTHRQGPKT